MAITIIDKPFDLVPAYNDVEYFFSSTQVAQPNFNYYITITISSTTYALRVPPDDGGFGYINIKWITEKVTRNLYPFGFGGWRSAHNSNGYKTFTINVGEEYGSTPTIHTGSNITLNVWNASLSIKERATYGPGQYTNFQWLNNYHVYTGTNVSARIARDHDLPFYFMDYNQLIDKVTVSALITTPLSQTLVGTADISNVTTLKYISINLSVSSINDFLGGSTPFDGTENSYLLEFCDAMGAVQTSAFIEIEDPCEVAAYQPRWLFYLNRFGAYDFIDMKLVSKGSLGIERVFYKAPPTKFMASRIHIATPKNGPSPIITTKKALSTTYQRNDILNSEWLTQEESENVKDLFTTPSVFVQNGFQDYDMLSPDMIRYEESNEQVDKNIKIVVPVNNALTEGRQIE